MPSKAEIMREKAQFDYLLFKISMSKSLPIILKKNITTQAKHLQIILQGVCIIPMHIFICKSMHKRKSLQ
jgi:hypothetical protein